MGRVRDELIVWTQFLAWLEAPVKDHPAGNRLKGFKSDELKFPDLSEPYLAQWLVDLGKCSSSGLGLDAFPWHEIEAWSNLTAIDVLPWEAKILRDLSEEYAVWLEKSKDITTPCPWVDAPSSRSMVSAQMRAGFASLMSGNRKKK